MHSPSASYTYEYVCEWPGQENQEGRVCEAVEEQFQAGKINSDVACNTFLLSIRLIWCLNMVLLPTLLNIALGNLCFYFHGKKFIYRKVYDASSYFLDHWIQYMNFILIIDFLYITLHFGVVYILLCEYVETDEMSSTLKIFKTFIL